MLDLISFGPGEAQRKMPPPTVTIFAPKDNTNRYTIVSLHVVYYHDLLASRLQAQVKPAPCSALPPRQRPRITIANVSIIFILPELKNLGTESSLNTGRTARLFTTITGANQPCTATRLFSSALTLT